MTNKTNIDEVVDNILKQISVQDTIVFIGAGLSRKLYNKSECIDGYLTMKEFIEKLFNEPQNMIDLDNQPILSTEPPFSIIKKLEDHNKNDIATKVVAQYGRNFDFICSRYETLLAIPFKAFITFNFDPMLRMASVNKQIPTITKQDLSFCSLTNKQFPISIYLHGTIDDGYKGIIISDNSFERYYGSDDIKSGKLVTDLNNGEAIFKCSLLSLILEHHLLFIGCSLSEEIFKKWMPFVGKRIDRSRIFLVPQKDCTSHPGMTVLPYPEIDGDPYKGLYEIIKEIKTQSLKPIVSDFNPDGGKLE